MIHAQESKVVPVVYPQVIKNNTGWVGTVGYTPTVVDTKGYHYAVFKWKIGATDIAQASLILSSTDTSDGTTNAVAYYTFGATGKLPLPTATDDNGVWKIYIDLRGKYRYHTVTAVQGNGSVGGYADGEFELWRGDISPTSATAHNLVGQDYV